MKQKISVTIDKDVLTLVKALQEDSKYRNTSHVVEHALNQLLKNETSKN